MKKLLMLMCLAVSLPTMAQEQAEQEDYEYPYLVFETRPTRRTSGVRGMCIKPQDGELVVRTDEETFTLSLSELTMMYFSNEEIPTGIVDTEVLQEQKDVKVYDLTGRVVKHPAKGVYIVNGKKVFVR